MIDTGHDSGACFHCGDPVTTGNRYTAVVEGVARSMCCTGCAAVAGAIAAGGYAAYYSRRSVFPEVSASKPLLEGLPAPELYDASEWQRNFVRSLEGSTREASLLVEGIHCGACVWLIEGVLSAMPGMLEVEVNVASHRARVRWDEGVLRLSGILRALRRIGYIAYPYDPSRWEEACNKERKSALLRLFVAGFAMMQVMMYAVPVYWAEGDMSRDIEQLMRWASFLLTLPVVFFSAGIFFSGAWRDLKAGRPGMDVPVALGIAAAFGASAWATVRGSGEVYFDSVSMFVFLLLGARFLEMGARAKAGQAVQALAKLIPAMARRLEHFPGSRETCLVPVSELRPGDHVWVHPGDALPADGVVAEGRTEVDESLLTGESRLISKRVGESVVGGSLNAASPVAVKVERVGEETMVADIIRLVERAAAGRPPLAQLADRVARHFIVALLGIAAVTGIVWWQVDPDRAFWITVAVLVVSCPCALSLATPVALTAATAALTRCGVLITRGHVLETLARATHVVFDKTGTLTEGRMALREMRPAAGRDRSGCLALAAAMEAGSTHPVGRALVAAGAEDAPLPGGVSVEHIVHIPGLGIEARQQGRTVRLGTPDFVAAMHRQPVPDEVAKPPVGMTAVGLGDETGWLSFFLLGDRLRPEAAETLATLHNLGLRAALASGDQLASTQAIATALGIEHFVGGARPADKLQFVAELQQQGAVVVMVGDGVNDAPVLAAAQVSVALGGGSEAARANGDVVLLSDDLDRLGYALIIARRTMGIVRQNLCWAFAYNLLAIPLAALGYVTPWMAGIGMAASSAIVVLNALRLLPRSATMLKGAARIDPEALQWTSSTC